MKYFFLIFWLSLFLVNFSTTTAAGAGGKKKKATTPPPPPRTPSLHETFLATQPPKNAIVWVMNPFEVNQKNPVAALNALLSRFKRTLRALGNHYLKPFQKKPSDVELIIFHSDINLTTNWQGELQDIYPPLKFIDVSDHRSFRIPEWRREDSPAAKFIWQGRCEIWWGLEQELFLNAYLLDGFIEHPALDHFEYVLRLELDVPIAQDLTFDPFQKARELDIAYAYSEVTYENPIFLDGLPEAIGRYVRKHRITPKYLRRLNPRTSYTGHFGLYKMSDWRNPQLRDLIHTLVHHERGVHCNYWKNPNIIALLLGLFFEKEKMILWPDLFIVGKSVNVTRHLNRSNNRTGVLLTKENDFVCKKDFGPNCSYLWDVLLSPHRSAVVTYSLDDYILSGIRVLHQSLINTGSLNNALFIVLDFGMSWQARNLLRSEGMILDYSHANKNLTSTHSFSLTRYQDVQWRMFSKLNIFGFDYVDRVVYMDADMFVYRSIAQLLDPSVTPALTAQIEDPFYDPEFNAGLIVFDPSSALLDDMILHLNDEYLCGNRVEDQSFLCHYFFRSWIPLMRFYQLNQIDYHYNTTRLEITHVLHFNRGEKPWDPKAPTDDEYYKFWFNVAASLDPPI